jgi:hypothetical protein
MDGVISPHDMCESMMASNLLRYKKIVDYRGNFTFTGNLSTLLSVYRDFTFVMQSSDEQNMRGNLTTKLTTCA